MDRPPVTCQGSNPIRIESKARRDRLVGCHIIEFILGDCSSGHPVYYHIGHMITATGCYCEALAVAVIYVTSPEGVILPSAPAVAVMV